MARLTRRFNYTNRHRIVKSSVHIDVVTEQDVVLAVVRKLDLSDRGQHSEKIWNDAEVFLEARRTTTESWSRHSLGIVASLNKASFPKRVPLDGFFDDQGITFRVKVVGGNSCLLADGDDIHCGKPDDAEREPLIHLVPSDLGEEIWRIDFNDQEGPRVLINRKLPHCSGILTSDPLIRGLVMPQILRTVLPVVAARDQQDDWVLRWLEFAKSVGADDPPSDEAEDEIKEWVDGVVTNFTGKQRFASLAGGFLDRTTSE